MDINLINSVTLEVTTKRTVKVGGKYHISPSYGYSGILTGIVEVTGIVVPDEVRLSPEEYTDIISYKDIHMQMIDKDDVRYPESKAYIENTMWVQYNYVFDTGEEGIFHFPVDEFIRHTSTLS